MCKLYACVILLIQLWAANIYIVFFIKFDVEKKRIICRNNVTDVTKFLWVYQFF